MRSLEVLISVALTLAIIVLAALFVPGDAMTKLKVATGYGALFIALFAGVLVLVSFAMGKIDIASLFTELGGGATYAGDLKKLQGLSQDDLDEITPNVTDHAVYGQLLDVVKDASARNLSQAQLKQRIEALGSVAISIVKKAKILGGMFS